TRQKFINRTILQLGLIQAQSGIESFKVVMDDTNNNKEDEENLKLNGTVIMVPTRTAEFISIDFIISSEGIKFV
ncbi:MAG: hypothetical protein AABY15_08000, partial [Nanoarchaeota archaeon]